MHPRKTTVGITYNGIDASNDLTPLVKSFSYTDSMDESDSISLIAVDKAANWTGGWFPANGDQVAPAILQENWGFEGEKRTLLCGDFVIDDFTISGPQYECKLNGVSAPVMSDFKETKNTKTWEAVTVRQIGEEIAGRYGLTLVYDVAEDITIDRQEQNSEADSTFLKSTCNRYGLGIKIYSSRLIIWSYRAYDQKDTAFMITPEYLIGKWSYKSSVQGTYTGAKVTYTDASKKEGIEVMAGTEGRLLTVNQKADSQADAFRIGENAIWNANRKENTLSLNISPDKTIFASGNVDISGFGKIDGKYRVEKVTHNISKTDYSEQLSLSRIV